jgi:hypothetical protein
MRIRTCVCLFVLVTMGARRADAQFPRVADPAPGEDFNVEIAAMFWQPTPELLIQTGALAAINESQVDFVEEFGIADKRFTEFRLVARGGKHKVRFSYVPIEYNQEAVLQRTITFGGRTFNLGLPATADLKWEMYRFGYEYDVVRRERGFFGIIGELKYNKVSANLNSPIGGELTEANAPVPALGVIGRAYPHRNFSLTAEFTGFKLPERVRNALTDDDLEAEIWDLDVYGTLSFGRHVGVQGGYRSVTASYLVEDDAGDLTLKGLYFGGMLRF